jgi:phenylacetyl-CoA:acceptor oxidoreductase subunit 2
MNKNRARKSFDLVLPRQQRNWDWRAAANFIAGGSGGGLLLWASFAGLGADVTRAAIVLGLTLIGSGLLCVWFEIGRPWRALNVYRHAQTSWMTREAIAALLVFALGAWAVFSVQPLAVFATGGLGLVFVYCQARILVTNKGIPTWRHPASVPLMVATGLAEGAGFLACVGAMMSSVSATAIPDLLMVFVVAIALRFWLWKSYLAALYRDGAPQGALNVLSSVKGRFAMLGHVLPAVAVVAILAGAPGQRGLLLLAGLLTIAGGWFLKFTLVRRAAFTQGLSLEHLPTRGNSRAGPQTKPGWRVVTSVG